MYYIITYDVSSPKRLPKILKTLRRYLNWVQNSVFEGYLTERQSFELEGKIKEIINKKEDSVIFYILRNEEVFKRNVIGIEKNELTNFL
jgi:CRISPR-associated protein Cas2